MLLAIEEQTATEQAAPEFALRACAAERAASFAGLRPGDTVLDICCGVGQSSLAAARAVAPSGWVLGIDASRPSVEEARHAARNASAHNVDFREASFESVRFPDESFDAVLCILELASFAAIEGAVARMWRLVRPSGSLAIAAWGAGLCEPGSRAFREALRRRRPDLFEHLATVDRMGEPERMRALFTAAGAETPFVCVEPVRLPLSRVRDLWAIALASGYGSVVEQLSDPAREAMQQDCREILERAGTRYLTADVVYAVATRRLSHR